MFYLPRLAEQRSETRIPSLEPKTRTPIYCWYWHAPGLQDNRQAVLQEMLQVSNDDTARVPFFSPGINYIVHHTDTDRVKPVILMSIQLDLLGSTQQQSTSWCKDLLRGGAQEKHRKTKLAPSSQS